jgi:NADH-quinone oxidoreductase subunit G
MIELQIDGEKVEVPEGSMVMHACEKMGTYVPHFCYHKKLSIAANCRMCLVEVEKAPKPMPACATPATQGMIVRTKSDKAINAQKGVMEFLLINHPLDCPICDQGGECQLQDLAVGYGGSGSRYNEEKRVVFHKDVGPLVSMEEMSRCIHCTRCIRFGQEVAGIMELGMTQRGEHSEITSFVANDVAQTVDSELSGNMIDICPVGALTSKPFRYSARTWELSRRKSVSPHDGTGANLIVQVKNNQVMRVLPLENEAVNECWIADRDRFSYEALNGPERLKTPMIKKVGVWQETDWATALQFIVYTLKRNGLISANYAHGLIATPNSTLEELYLAKALMNGLGSDNIDTRLRNAEFAKAEGVRWLGTSIASLSTLQRVLVIGSNLRKDHPLFAQRIRQATRKGAQVHVINESTQDWAMNIASTVIAPAAQWAKALAEIAAAVAADKNVAVPVQVTATDAAKAIAKSLISGERKAVLLGNAAAHHAGASQLLALANWIAEQTGATVGYLTESANTVGAQLVKAQPMNDGLNAQQMLSGGVKALFLLNAEPGHDTAAHAKLNDAELVVTMSPFKANMDISNVLLPISPFTETAGTFVNAEGRAQSFNGVVKPLGETRPAWKVLRVLGSMLDLADFNYETIEEVRAKALPNSASDIPAMLSNKTSASLLADAMPGTPCTASIYQLDGIVRRAPSLQLTADAKAAATQDKVAA